MIYLKELINKNELVISSIKKYNDITSKEEKENLDKNNNNLNIELDCVRTQAVILKMNNEKLTSENIKLKSDIATCKNEVNEDKKYLNDHKNEIYQSKNYVENLYVDINKYKGDNDELKKSKSILLKQLTNLEKSVGTNVSNKTNLIEDLVKITNLEKTLQEKNERFNALKMELNKYEKISSQDVSNVSNVNNSSNVNKNTSNINNVSIIHKFQIVKKVDKINQLGNISSYNTNNKKGFSSTFTTPKRINTEIVSKSNNYTEHFKLNDFNSGSIHFECVYDKDISFLNKKRKYNC